MSITTTNVKNEYSVSSSTDTFAFTFRWFSLDEIEVRVNNVLLVKDTDYTFDNTNSTYVGGSVVLTTAISSGDIEILRNTPVEQQVDYGTTTVFPSSSAQGVDDRAIAIMQEISQVTVDVPSFPTPVADTVLGWDTTGTSLENKTLPDIEEYEQLASDVATAQATADSAQTDATEAKNTADSAQLDADGAKVTSVEALAKANLNEANLAVTEAKASSALSLATNNADAIALIDTSVFMDKATYVPRLDAVETLASENETRSSQNEADLTDVKSDIVDIQEELASFTQRYDQYIGNNVTVATALNGMSFNKVENPFAYITINGYRTNDDGASNFTIQLYAFWNVLTSLWEVGRLSSYYDDMDGIVFDMQTLGDVGTVVYTTNEITGLNYDGHAYYRADKLLG